MRLHEKWIHFNNLSSFSSAKIRINRDVMDICNRNHQMCWLEVMSP